MTGKPAVYGFITTLVMKLVFWCLVQCIVKVNNQWGNTVISPFPMTCRSINAPASSIERGFVSFPRRGTQYLWHNTWHKTNLVNVALGREIPRNTPLSQKINYSAGNGKTSRREWPGQNPRIWSAFFCSGGHNQMLEMRKNREILFMLFAAHTFSASNYFQLWDFLTHI